MRLSLFLICAALGLGSVSCGVSSRPLIRRVSPLNGSTAVELTVTPLIEVAGSTSIDVGSRRLVLYDVTSSARKTVAARVEIAGSVLTYHPTDPLPANHAFELVLERGAVTGESVDELDGSEAPEEALSWPYRLWFSTRQCPRVRAAYLDRGTPPRITIGFSQPMDPLSTSKLIAVWDLAQRAQPAQPVSWVDSRTARLALDVALDVAAPYTLRVGGAALSEGNVTLDGNDDGISGGASDTFSASFTGSQSVIFSRQPHP